MRIILKFLNETPDWKSSGIGEKNIAFCCRVLWIFKYMNPMWRKFGIDLTNFYFILIRGYYGEHLNCWKFLWQKYTK